MKKGLKKSKTKQTQIKEKSLRDLEFYDERPWGKYQVLEKTAHWKVKRIEVKPRQRLSYQRHFLRREHWVIVQGRAIVTLEGNELYLKPGDSVDIPVKAGHRIANPGKKKLVFIEIQQGKYFGEDDIERLEDDYGRNLGTKGQNKK